MKTIQWDSIAPPEDFCHVASIDFFGPSASARHDHDFYECFVVTAGQGRQWMPEGHAPLRPEHIYFIRPEHMHALVDPDRLAVVNIAFASLIAESCLPLLELPSACWAKGGGIFERGLTRHQTRKIIDAASEASGRPGKLAASGLLFEIARILARPHSGDSDPAAWPDWFAQALPECTDPATLAEGLPALIRKMGRSAEHISRTFRTCLDQTPTQWLTRERIRRACLLLATTRKSILEIVLDCGFESPSYFHKCFRENTGTTPRNYRIERRCIQPPA